MGQHIWVIEKLIFVVMVLNNIASSLLLLELVQLSSLDLNKLEQILDGDLEDFTTALISDNESKRLIDVESE